MTEKRISLPSQALRAEIFGVCDSNVKNIEKECDVTVYETEDGLCVTGEEENAARAAHILEALIARADKGETASAQTLAYLAALSRENSPDELDTFTERGDEDICVSARGKRIRAKTVGQLYYTDAIRRHTVTVAAGPAGTGKTFLAVAMAVTALKNKQVGRIILTRPAVEAGERLGFLPGDLQSKIDPYLRPLYDALYELLGTEGYAKCAERGEIEIAPLAYMRGRTLDDSFIILDEAQNTTSEQMKMFLTRLGFGSKIVVTGDMTQIDLPRGVGSGLVEAVDILDGIPDIAVVRMSEKDIVRHNLVQKIIKAYETPKTALKENE